MQNLRLIIRMIFGIIIPGGFFCLIICWGLFGILGPFHNYLFKTNFLNFSSWFLIIILIILSYMTGNIIRLSQTDKVDNKSAKYNQKRNRYTSSCFKVLTELIIKYEGELINKQQSEDQKRNKIKKLNNLYKKYDKRVWIFEKFPYPKWQTRKRILYHSETYRKFFEKYPKGMTVTTKEFFNFCKTTISGLNPDLREEISYAESLTRFFAGVYFAIRIGMWIVLGTITLQMIYCILFKFSTQLSNFVVNLFTSNNSTMLCDLKLSIIIIIISIIIFVIFCCINKEILNRFRGIRLKEVDTVYDAFFIVCKKHPEIEL